MKVFYRPEPIGDGLWIVRRYIDGEKDIIVQHKPFENQFEAQQYARLLMRDIPRHFARKFL